MSKYLVCTYDTYYDGWSEAGCFKDRKEAQEYAIELLNKGDDVQLMTVEDDYDGAWEDEE